MPKLKLFFFYLKSGRKLTIGVKFQVNVRKRGRGSCCFFLSQVLFDMLMESSQQNFGLLIERISSIYLKVRIKDLSSVICFVFYRFWINSYECRKRSAMREVYRQFILVMMPMILPSELYKYVIDKELLHTGGGRCGRDRMVVGFTTTYAINVYHH